MNESEKFCPKRTEANSTAVETVLDYLESLDETGLWYGLSFEDLSYSAWAAKELLRLLAYNSNDVPPLSIMENFKEKMEKYAKINNGKNYIFAIAAKAVRDIIDWLV